MVDVDSIICSKGTLIICSVIVTYPLIPPYDAIFKNLKKKALYFFVLVELKRKYFHIKIALHRIRSDFQSCADYSMANRYCIKMC